MSAKTKMPSYSVSQWVDLETGNIIYGIQRGGKHCAMDGKALLYHEFEVAFRHCRWLNDPKGTEPEWNDGRVDMGKKEGAVA